ncbi:MAG TPA: alpha/beta hydrolase [Dermatophilaceae bacterium]|nr:alpha/beta hydrolase [Dermatophilaceae bacterium]
MTSHSSWDLPLRTRLLAHALSRLRTPVSRLERADLPAARAWGRPARMPYAWVTGPVYSDVAISRSSFTARDGATVPLRLYRPTLPGASAAIPRPERFPVVVWFHGGGWCLGNLDGYDPLCSWMAHEAQVLVVSVDYRLAPEHPAPQAVHDCVDAVRWVSAHADSLAADLTSLGLAGDSAGGNLAAVVAQVLRDAGGPPVGYQCLLYPGTDATMSMPSVRTHADAPILTRADMDTFVGYYLGGGTDSLPASDPLVSPLLAADHRGLPPALIQTADLDPLRDEGLAYAEKLEAAGVPVRVTNYPRTPHGFHSFPGATPVGRAARAELAGWIATHSRKRLVH